MAFTFAAFTYICALIIDAFLIFFAIFHVRTLLITKISFFLFNWRKKAIVLLKIHILR